MDRVRLEQYLSGRLGEAVRITSLSQAFPGLSRETWLVRLERGRVGVAVEQGLVVRADSPGGPFPPVPLEYEYQVYVHRREDRDSRRTAAVVRRVAGAVRRSRTVRARDDRGEHVAAWIGR